MSIARNLKKNSLGIAMLVSLGIAAALINLVDSVVGSLWFTSTFIIMTVSIRIMYKILVVVGVLVSVLGAFFTAVSANLIPISRGDLIIVTIFLCILGIIAGLYQSELIIREIREKISERRGAK